MITLSRDLVIVGPGLMGTQVGVEFALHGFTVNFLSRDVARAEARTRSVLDDLLRLGLLDRDGVADAENAISIVDRAARLPKRADLILECLPEDLDLKVRVIRHVIDRVDAAVIGTNTASLRVAAIGDGIGVPERTLGMHYWSPPLLMPLVEVTTAPATSQRVIDIATSILEQSGKVVIRVQRDVPGFVWNRLQMAVLREALWLLDNGVATVAEIDKVTQLGLARRWRQVGLFESVFLGGAQNWETVASNLFPELSNADAAVALAQRVIAESARWEKSQQRREEGLARDDAPPGWPRL